MPGTPDNLLPFCPSDPPNSCKKKAAISGSLELLFVCWSKFQSVKWEQGGTYERKETSPGITCCKISSPISPLLFLRWKFIPQQCVLCFCLPVYAPIQGVTVLCLPIPIATLDTLLFLCANSSCPVSVFQHSYLQVVQTPTSRHTCSSWVGSRFYKLRFLHKWGNSPEISA